MTAALPIRFVEKPWGQDELPAPFDGPPGKRIGEIWFEPSPAMADLLVKYIFASEKLSVQVHPSDTQTRAKGLGRMGKEECWLIIDAKPGATLGIGFDTAIAPEAIRAAALDGSIEQRLIWHKVEPGDFFYIPSNTVHAIGAGVSLIEVQQNSNITYRLYDYGRPRELHLDKGLAVARGEPYPLERWHKKVSPRGSKTLVDGPLFVLDQIEGHPSQAFAARYPGAFLVIPRSGPVEVRGKTLPPGACGLAGTLDDLRMPATTVCLFARSCAQDNG